MAYTPVSPTNASQNPGATLAMAAFPGSGAGNGISFTNTQRGALLVVNTDANSHVVTLSVSGGSLASVAITVPAASGGVPGFNLIYPPQLLQASISATMQADVWSVTGMYYAFVTLP